MQKVKLRVVLFLSVIVLTSFNPEKGIKDLWQRWDEIQQLMPKEPRPIIIDIYTDWCIYCKKMDASTYRNDSVCQYLKTHYYRFKFNAESKDTLVWHDKKFGFNKTYQVHDFVQYVSQGAIVFPTTVIITTNGQILSTGGMLHTKEIEPILKYYASAKPVESFEVFAKQYVPSWK